MQGDYFIRTANTDHRISEFNRIACIIPLLDRAKKEAILMKIKKELCIIMAAISLLSFTACSGTAASEPDGENKDRGNGTESASQVSAESRTESSPSDKDPQQASMTPDGGSAETAYVTAPVIKLDDRVVTKAEYMRLCGDAMDGKYTVEDKDVISALTGALSRTRIGDPSDTRMPEETHQVTLYFENGNSETVVFEGGGYIKANQRYELGGWREVSDVLDTITVKGTKYGARELDYDSSQWIERMAVVENKIASVTKTEEYTNGNTETRYKIAMDALKELEEQGYVRRGSIYYDGEASISFIYECCEEGVLGGIMLRGFDPYMNEIDNVTDNGTDNTDRTSFSGTYMDFLDKVYKMPATDEDREISDFYGFIKQDGSHWKLNIHISTDISGESILLKLERQISGGIEYSRLSAVSDGKTLYDSAVYFDGSNYYISGSDRQHCKKATESECKNILSYFELEKYFGKDFNCGICSFEEKHAVYREYVSDSKVTVLFFDSSGLLGGNIYTPTGYVDDNVSLPPAADYGKLILSGRISGSLSLEADSSLSEIPPTESV